MRKAVITLGERVLLKRVDATSVISLIKETLAIVRDAPLLEAASLRGVVKQVIERVGAGVDGVSGTPDDIIPIETVRKIGAMLESKLLDDLLDTLVAPVKAACGGCSSFMRRRSGPVRPQPLPESKAPK